MPRPYFFSVLLAGALGAVLGPAEPADAARRVTCGQTFEGEGALSSSCAGDIVVAGGRLDLRGFTVHGSIACTGAYCLVVSDPPNGAVRGSRQPGSIGISAGGAIEGAGDLAIDNVIVAGFGTGVAAANVQVVRSLVAGNVARGVDALMGIETVDAIVSLNGDDGLHARLGGVSLDRTLVSENGGSGVRALAGVAAFETVVRDNGRDGIENYSAPAVVAGSTIVGNGRHGVRSDDSDCVPADGLTVTGSEIAGNAVDPACGSEQVCADLVACAAPAMDPASVCVSSHQMASGLPGASWGTCSGD